MDGSTTNLASKQLSVVDEKGFGLQPFSCNPSAAQETMIYITW